MRELIVERDRSYIQIAGADWVVSMTAEQAIKLASRLVELATQIMVDTDRKEFAEARWPTTTTTTSGS